MKRQPKPAIERAFEQSDSAIFKGIKLQPYTPSRAVAADAMGLRYPNIPNGFSRYSETGTYPGILSDVIIVIGVCMMTDTEATDAKLDPRPAYEKTERWAFGQGIKAASGKAFEEAKAIFEKIMWEAHVSRSEQASASGRASTDEGDESGNE